MLFKDLIRYFYLTQDQHRITRVNQSNPHLSFIILYRTETREYHVIATLAEVFRILSCALYSNIVLFMVSFLVHFT